MKIDNVNNLSLYFLGFFLGLIPITNILTILLINIISAEPTSNINFDHSVIIGFITICMLPAIIEEIIFRGLLQTILMRAGVGVALAGTSLLFTLLHIGNLTGIPAIFVLSFFLSIAKFMFGSVYYTIVLHLINNCFAYSIFLLNYYYSPNTAFVLTITLYILFSIVSAVILIIGRKQWPTGIKLLWKRRLIMLARQ